MSFLKSFLPLISEIETSFSSASASLLTSSGNLYGNSYSFISDNMSTPASFTPPITSIIFPSGFRSFCAGFVISTTTLWLFLALPKLAFEINMSELIFLSSGTTKPKFLLFINVLVYQLLVAAKIRHIFNIPTKGDAFFEKL